MKTWKVFALTLGFTAAAFAQDLATGIMPTVSGKIVPSPIDAAQNPPIIYHGGPVLGTVANKPVRLYFNLLRRLG